MTIILTIPSAIIVSILRQKVAQTNDVVSKSDGSFLDDQKIETQI